MKTGSEEYIKVVELNLNGVSLESGYLPFVAIVLAEVLVDVVRKRIAFGCDGRTFVGLNRALSDITVGAETTSTTRSRPEIRDKALS